MIFLNYTENKSKELDFTIGGVRLYFVDYLIDREVG